MKRATAKRPRQRRPGRQEPNAAAWSEVLANPIGKPKPGKAERERLVTRKKALEAEVRLEDERQNEAAFSRFIAGIRAGDPEQVVKALMWVRHIVWSRGREDATCDETRALFAAYDVALQQAIEAVQPKKPARNRRNLKKAAEYFFRVKELELSGGLQKEAAIAKVASEEGRTARTIRNYIDDFALSIGSPARKQKPISRMFTVGGVPALSVVIDPDRKLKT